MIALIVGVSLLFTIFDEKVIFAVHPLLVAITSTANIWACIIWMRRNWNEASRGIFLELVVPTIIIGIGTLKISTARVVQ